MKFPTNTNSAQMESLLTVPSLTHVKVHPMRTASNASSIGRPNGNSAAGIDDPDEDESGLGYTHTLMYGRYTKDLGEFAKDEARKLKLLEKRRKQEDKQRNKCWEIFTGIAGQTFVAHAKSLIMDMETYICAPWRRLGVLGAAGRHNGLRIVCGGQRHQCLYKCARVALSRSHLPADHTVFRMGLTAGLFDTLLSRLCASRCAAKYRFRYT
uniref:Chloride channel protein 2 n=1 Tax=Bactrocera dorsalis TaxID=27457 RepID=A0A034VB89_BACDO